MKDESKTKAQLLKELAELRLRLAEMEKLESERKQAVQEVQRLASFPQLNPNPVLEIDLSGRITFFNAACIQTVERLGVTEGVSVFVPKDIQQIAEGFRQKNGFIRLMRRWTDVGNIS
jgi:PAS domain-containing protein